VTTWGDVCFILGEIFTTSNDMGEIFTTANDIGEILLALTILGLETLVSFGDNLYLASLH
jgi:hypothetical protein